MELAMLRRVCAVVLAGILWASAARAGHAQAPAGEAVQFGAVEAGTVRVFAVQHVDVLEVPTDRGPRVVALPNMGHGTGFAVPGDDRLLLTAAHVVTDASYVVVRLPGDGAYYPARVAHRDEERDVAVLLIEGDVPALSLQPPEHALRTRQSVFTVGYPLDASRRQAQSSRGIVGGVLEDGRVQLDMDVNPGNSGGPVIDEADQVVGMLVARGDVERGVQGLAVAVPLTTLHEALASARQRIREGRVPALPSDAPRAAHVIDTLSRVGLMRIMREASDVTEGTADMQSIQEVRTLNGPELSPDMQVFVACFLWDAAQMLMYRSGDHVNPSSMPAGATRDLAEQLLSEASALLRSAIERDPTTADRSPFVRVAQGGGGVLISSEALRPIAEAFPAAAAVEDPPVAPAEWQWRPRRSWALMAGGGLGIAGFYGGQEERDDYSLWSPLAPGLGLRVFGALKLTLGAAFDVLVELDFHVMLAASASSHSSPPARYTEGDFALDDNAVGSVGGAGVLMVRFHPRGGLFFVGPGVRIGAHRFSGWSRATDERASARYRVVQPGFEVGVQLDSMDLYLRAHLGIPGEDDGKRAGIYVTTLTASFRLAGADL